MDRKKVRRWVALCNLRIMLGQLLTLVCLGFLTLVLLPDYLRYGTRVLLWVAAALAVALAVKGYDLALFILRKQQAKPGEVSFMEQTEVVRSLTVLAGLRRMVIPDIIWVSGERTGGLTERMLRWLIGILDRPVGKDTIMIGVAAAELLTEEEMRGVLAHEIRHKDAWENKTGFLLKVLRLWVGMAFFFCTTHFFWLAVLRTEPAFWQGMLGLLWARLVFSGGMSVSKFFEALASRATELKVDALAARDLGSPDPLLSSLPKIEQAMLAERDGGAQQGVQADDRNSPLKRALKAVLRSHPPVPDRTRALNALR